MLKHTEEREYAHYSKPVAHSDEYIESIDFTRLHSMPIIFDKKVPSLSTLDDFPIELDQEPLGKSCSSLAFLHLADLVVAVDEELPSDEFNAGFDALAPLELELTF